MKFRTFFREKAVYLVLLACIFAAAFFSFRALRSAVRKLTPQDTAQEEEKTWTQPKAEASNDEEDIPILPDSAGDSAASSEPEPSSVPSQPAQELPDAQESSANWSEPAAASFGWPVTGELMQGFSGDELCYNETLKDWRTHNGVDLACTKGAEVKASAAGKISAVYEDPLWGWVVEQESGEDVCRYCGLAAKPTAKTGDTVAAGDVLGTVGTVAAEQSAESHLHFEVLRGGVYQDPQKLFG